MDDCEVTDGAPLLGDVVEDGGQRPLAAAHPASGGDLAVLQRDPGLEIEQSAEEGGRPAPAAPSELLSRQGGGLDGGTDLGGDDDDHNAVSTGRVETGEGLLEPSHRSGDRKSTRLNSSHGYN